MLCFYLHTKLYRNDLFVF